MLQKNRVLKYFSTPPAKWDRLCSRMSAKDLQAVATSAIDMAQECARIGEYLDYRGAAGCGDHGHAAAMSAAFKCLKRVRKALGFSYP